MAPLTELASEFQRAEVLARSSSEQKNEALVCAADALRPLVLNIAFKLCRRDPS